MSNVKRWNLGRLLRVEEKVREKELKIVFIDNRDIMMLAIDKSVDNLMIKESNSSPN